MIHLMRHGQSEANLVNMAGGDLPLTDEGRRQVAEAQLLGDVTCVVSSTLLRARETAEIVAGRLGLRVPAGLPELDEMGFGRYEGRVVDDWFSGMYGSDMAGLFAQVGGDDPVGRARAALAVLDALPDGALAVTSATLIRCMASLAATGRVTAYPEMPPLGNCGVVGYDRRGRAFSWGEAKGQATGTTRRGL